MNIFIFIIICIIIFLWYNSNNFLELFDARMSDVSKEKCGDTCTKIYNCVGMAYDNNNKKCYLSQSPIVGQNAISLYSDEYRTTFDFCNKPNPIKDYNDYDVFQAPIKNTVYTCKVGEEGSIEYDSIINGQINKLDSKNSKIQISDYKLKPLVWPVEKKDIDANYVNIDDYLNKLVFFDYDNKNEYQGTFLFPSKCDTNISLFDCLKTCSINKNCNGVDFNPSKITKQESGKYKTENNICCPKSTITKKITRTADNKNGAYYSKKLEDNAYIGNIYIRQSEL